MDYFVAIRGIETVPLKTTEAGVLELLAKLIKEMDKPSFTSKQLLSQINSGVIFKTSTICISSKQLELTNGFNLARKKAAKKAVSKKIRGVKVTSTSTNANATSVKFS